MVFTLFHFYGKYKNGKKHEQGTLILPNGKKIPGIWENGKLKEETDDFSEGYLKILQEKEKNFWDFFHKGMS